MKNNANLSIKPGCAEACDSSTDYCIKQVGHLYLGDCSLHMEHCRFAEGTILEADMLQIKKEAAAPLQRHHCTGSVFVQDLGLANK